MSTSSCPDVAKLEQVRKKRTDQLMAQYVREIEHAMITIVNQTDAAIFYDRSLSIDRTKIMNQALKQVIDKLEQNNGQEI